MTNRKKLVFPIILLLAALIMAATSVYAWITSETILDPARKEFVSLKPEFTYKVFEFDGAGYIPALTTVADVTVPTDEAYPFKYVLRIPPYIFWAQPVVRYFKFVLYNEGGFEIYASFFYDQDNAFAGSGDNQNLKYPTLDILRYYLSANSAPVAFVADGTPAISGETTPESLFSGAKQHSFSHVKSAENDDYIPGQAGEAEFFMTADITLPAGSMRCFYLKVEYHEPTLWDIVKYNQQTDFIHSAFNVVCPIKLGGYATTLKISALGG